MSIHYPRRDIDPVDVFTQQTFNLATAQLMSWRQGPGTFGGLHLHPCWGESSVLDRRYQGHTTGSFGMLDGVMKLHDHTGDVRWQCLADDMVATILQLQTTTGGFYHAS